MNEKVLHLEDGSTVSAKVNFATLYYMQQSGVAKHLKDNPEEMDDDDALMVAAHMLHVLLLSNGRNVTFQEALVLCPLDLDEVREVFEDFQNRLEQYEKKREAAAEMKAFVAAK